MRLETPSSRWSSERFALSSFVISTYLFVPVSVKRCKDLLTLIALVCIHEYHCTSKLFSYVRSCTHWQDRLFLMEYLIEFYIIKVENINFYWETRLLLWRKCFHRKRERENIDSKTWRQFLVVVYDKFDKMAENQASESNPLHQRNRLWIVDLIKEWG